MLQCIELLVLFINETVDVGRHRKVCAVGVEMQFTMVDRGLSFPGLENSSTVQAISW